MAEVQWIKIVTNFYSNRKMRRLYSTPTGREKAAIWFALLGLAGAINQDGKLYFTTDKPYTLEDLAVEFGVPEDLMSDALSTFREYDMIVGDTKGTAGGHQGGHQGGHGGDNVIVIKNWEKYQNAEQLSVLRERARVKKQKQRAAGRDNKGDTRGTQRGHNGDCPPLVPPVEIEREIEKEIDKEKDTLSPYVERVEKDGENAVLCDGGDKSIGKKEGKKSPPSEQEVVDFCAEHDLLVDPYRFFEYYSERKWKGVTDWTLRLMSWERKEQKEEAQRPKTDKRDTAKQTISSFDTHDAFYQSLLKTYSKEDADWIMQHRNAPPKEPRKKGIFDDVDI